MAWNIIFVSCIDFKDIKDKRTLRYIQNLEKNMMKLFIILNKSSGFFVQEKLKIMECYSNFKISKGVKLST